MYFQLDCTISLCRSLHGNGTTLGQSHVHLVCKFLVLCLSRIVQSSDLACGGSVKVHPDWAAMYMTLLTDNRVSSNCSTHKLFAPERQALRDYFIRYKGEFKIPKQENFEARRNRIALLIFMCTIPILYTP